MNDQCVQELQRHCSQLLRRCQHALSTLHRQLQAPPRHLLQTARPRPASATAAFFGTPQLQHPPSTKQQQPATTAAITPSLGVPTREDVGRATWLFLHTLAAQYPERPTRQQKKDAKTLMDVLTRMYPCGECARHFKEIVAAHPPEVGSRAEFSRWMCRVHNVVNRSLDKPTFNCDLVEARWAGLECGGEGEVENACVLDGSVLRKQPGSGKGVKDDWWR